MEQQGGGDEKGPGDQNSQDAAKLANESKVASEAKALSEARDHAWQYFALNADQRLRTFNFYLIAAALVVGGLMIHLKDTRSSVVVILAGFVLTVLSLIFWLLDRRAKELVECGQEVLQAIEQAPARQTPQEFRVFVKQDEKTKRLIQTHGEAGLTARSWRGHFDYTACYRAAYLIFGSLGIVIFIVGVGAIFFPSSAPPGPVQNFYIGNPTVKPAP